ncbi:hypothetical protein H8959_009559 [Pygathrix nigripes]
MDIKLVEALHGFQKPIPTLDNQIPVNTSHPPTQIVKHRDTKCVLNEGHHEPLSTDLQSWVKLNLELKGMRHLHGGEVIFMHNMGRFPKLRPQSNWEPRAPIRPPHCAVRPRFQLLGGTCSGSAAGPPPPGSGAAPEPSWGKEDAHLFPQSGCGLRHCADSGSCGRQCRARATGARPAAPGSSLSRNPVRLLSFADSLSAEPSLGIRNYWTNCRLDRTSDPVPPRDPPPAPAPWGSCRRRHRRAPRKTGRLYKDEK